MRRGWILLFILGAVFAAPTALPTRFVPLTLEQLAAQADLVVRGTVRVLETARDKEARIFTRVRLQVLDVWKGRVDSGTCELVCGGGVLGDESVEVDGQARYAVGDEWVVFLVRNPAGELVTAGLLQGQFRVRTEAGTGRKWVESGLSIWREPALGAGSTTPSPRRLGIPLDELKRRTVEGTR